MKKFTDWFKILAGAVILPIVAMLIIGGVSMPQQAQADGVPLAVMANIVNGTFFNNSPIKNDNLNAVAFTATGTALYCVNSTTGSGNYPLWSSVSTNAITNAPGGYAMTNCGIANDASYTYFSCDNVYTTASWGAAGQCIGVVDFSAKGGAKVVGFVNSATSFQPQNNGILNIPMSGISSNAPIWWKNQSF
jgi:hypothetical protein